MVTVLQCADKYQLGNWCLILDLMTKRIQFVHVSNRLRVRYFKMKFIAFILSLTVVSTQQLQKIHIEDKLFWRSVGSSTLDSVLDRKQNNGVAKNVIVFVGDGMGVSTITAARIYQGQVKNDKGESNALFFENFPSVGLSKTYDVTHQVADSASTATAMFSGVKTTHSVLGLDALASYNVCVPDTNERSKVVGAMTWAQESGKDTGIVTTTRITHATPAATYAHINNRDWECDSSIPEGYADCVKDIARQLIEDAPGNKFKVIMGGGNQQLGIGMDPNKTCIRKDGRNLVELWKKGKQNAKTVSTREELESIDMHETDYLLGIFAPSHLPYVGENDTSRPSLRLMTETAINILSKNANGFVLLVEGGRIDMAHHSNMAKLALIETLEFEEAVEAAVHMTNPEETLIIVTADHSHSVVLNGYPKRGNDILGLAESTDKLFFETITYTNGPGYEYHHPVQQLTQNCRGSCSEVEKQSANAVRDIRNDETRYADIHYKHFASFYREDETHGGEDVAVYATGPRSHLLVGVYEQNFIANVISYAACIGPEAHRCKRRSRSSSGSQFSLNSLLLYLLIVPLFTDLFRLF